MEMDPIVCVCALQRLYSYMNNNFINLEMSNK